MTAWPAPSSEEAFSIGQAAKNPDNLIKLDRPPYGFELAKGVSIGAEPAGNQGYSIKGKLYFTSGGGFGPMGRPMPVNWFQVKAPSDTNVFQAKKAWADADKAIQNGTKLMEQGTAEMDASKYDAARDQFRLASNLRHKLARPPEGFDPSTAIGRSILSDRGQAVKLFVHEGKLLAEEKLITPEGFKTDWYWMGSPRGSSTQVDRPDMGELVQLNNRYGDQFMQLEGVQSIGVGIHTESDRGSFGTVEIGLKPGLTADEERATKAAVAEKFDRISHEHLPFARTFIPYQFVETGASVPEPVADSPEAAKSAS